MTTLFNHLAALYRNIFMKILGTWQGWKQEVLGFHTHRVLLARPDSRFSGLELPAVTPTHVSQQLVNLNQVE